MTPRNATHKWEPHIPRCPTRVHETSCCGEYEWASEGGEYLILRWTGNGETQEETGRGVYAAARAVWSELATQHRHRRKA